MMRNEEKLNLALEKCKQQLNELGIQYSNVLKITENKKAKKRLRQCKNVSLGVYEIDISSVLLDERVPEMTLRTTVMHELLHTCNGCMNHGALWKSNAEMVNHAYSYHIKRAASVEERGIADVVREVNKPKYVFECIQCGAKIYRHRESKFTRNYERYRCGKCGGHLIKK